MAYREVHLLSIREVIIQRIRGRGLRRISSSTGLDRKTVRRYVEAMAQLRVDAPPDGASVEAWAAEVAPRVMAAVRVGSPGGAGDVAALWERVEPLVAKWHADGVACRKMRRLLRERHGEQVALRTLQRLVKRHLRVARGSTPTQWVADCAPGAELQVDFCELGWTLDVDSGKRRKLHALVMVAVRTRHMFVWPTWQCTAEELVAGLEAALSFFGGVFSAVIIDNTKAAVRRVSMVDAGLHPALLEHKQRCGYEVCTSRVRRPQDKARVERNNRYVQGDLFGGETSRPLAAWRTYAAQWCREVAGLRNHQETQRQPLHHFETEELPALAALPTTPWSTPRWSSHIVGRDGRVRVRTEHYVVRGYVREEVAVRLDSTTVEVFHKGSSVLRCARIAPGQTGGDVAHLRGLEHAASQRNPAPMLQQAATHGPSVLAVAQALLSQSPWFTQVNRFRHLMKLCAEHGSGACDRACAQAIALDVVDVVRIQRYLERCPPQPVAAVGAVESMTPPPPTATTGALPRFARPLSAFLRGIIAA